MAEFLAGAAIEIRDAAVRRLRCCGGSAALWRRQILAVAAVISAVVILFGFALPFPLANRWFVSPSAPASPLQAAASLSDTTFPPFPFPPPPPSIFPATPAPISSPPPPPPTPPTPPPISPASPAPIEDVRPTSPNASMITGSPPPPFLVSPPPPAMTVNSDDATKSGGADLSPPSSRSEVPYRLTHTDRELKYAKEEIGRAPLVLDDPDLYAPLFRNVSVFKRSYELMEKILKVYIYRDGARPIFHTPELKGIYASEGWFMKLMEENKKFVVKDPNKAHLFYLPYSARQLEVALYVPNSHKLLPLMIFLKNYVNMISAKYPFWNRTRGSDHFLVACHDWGPYTTRLHEELHKNTIKALCNADVSEDGFVRGKDVSLPETSIRTPRRPLREIGGKPASQRSILAFFAGNMHGPLRPILLKYWKDKDEDMKIYGPLPKRVAQKMSYIQHMKSSKFCICPMGYEVNSPRIVEAIYYECVPVIIADNFVPPLDEVLDWSRFSLIVAERDIPQLKDILSRVSIGKYATMQMNVKRLQRHFLWHAKPVKYDIFHMILHSIWFSRLNQI